MVVTINSQFVYSVLSFSFAAVALSTLFLAVVGVTIFVQPSPIVHPVESYH